MCVRAERAWVRSDGAPGGRRLAPRVDGQLLPALPRLAQPLAPGGAHNVELEPGRKGRWQAGVKTACIGRRRACGSRDSAGPRDRTCRGAAAAAPCAAGRPGPGRPRAPRAACPCPCAGASSLPAERRCRAAASAAALAAAVWHCQRCCRHPVWTPHRSLVPLLLGAGGPGACGGSCRVLRARCWARLLTTARPCVNDQSGTTTLVAAPDDAPVPCRASSPPPVGRPRIPRPCAAVGTAGRPSQACCDQAHKQCQGMKAACCCSTTQARQQQAAPLLAAATGCGKSASGHVGHHCRACLHRCPGGSGCAATPQSTSRGHMAGTQMAATFSGGCRRHKGGGRERARPHAAHPPCCGTPQRCSH